MAVKLITYDLCTPGKDYSSLYDKLDTYSNCMRIEESVYLTNSTKSCSTIRDELKTVLDSNDRLFVAKLTGEAAWTNLLVNGDKVKKLFES